MAEVLKPLPDDHVAADVYEDVRKWNNLVVCMPTWEEIREVEYVRQRGEINMVTDDLETYCWNRALMDAVAWIQRCKKARIFWGQYYKIPAVMNKFEAEHGPHDGWITEEYRDEKLAIEYRIDEMLLDRKQQELQERQAKLKKRKQCKAASQ